MPLRKELLAQAKLMYPHYTYLAKYKKHELKSLLDQKCSKTNDYKHWADNSCYIDSLLFVINILQIKPKLPRHQTNIIKQIQECLNNLENTPTAKIRKLLSSYSGSSFNWLTEQQEPMDLWRTLEEMFVMYKTKVQVEQIDGETNNLIDLRTHVQNTDIQEVHLPMKRRYIKTIKPSTSLRICWFILGPIQKFRG